jgi:hypothetical protein
MLKGWVSLSFVFLFICITPSRSVILNICRCQSVICIDTPVARWEVKTEFCFKNLRTNIKLKPKNDNPPENFHKIMDPYNNFEKNITDYQPMRIYKELYTWLFVAYFSLKNASNFHILSKYYFSPFSTTTVDDSPPTTLTFGSVLQLCFNFNF